jgi:hypothetical protein
VSIRPAVFWLHLLVGVTAIASGGGAVLVWTGLSLAWRRYQAWRRRVIPALLPASPLPGQEASAD